MKSEKILGNVLKAHPKAVVHLRRQFNVKRFGLILGAGVSLDFKVPKWEDLVNQIAANPKVNGVDLLTGDMEEKSLRYKTEILFQKFRTETERILSADLSALAKYNTVHAEWIEICAGHLYPSTSPSIETAINDHPYFADLLPLVQESMLTINFNFDDFLERSLALQKREVDSQNKGFEVVTDPWPQFRRRDCVIYHPHGIIPFGSSLMELPSDRFVFSEAAYSTQYVGPRGHDTSFFISHLARNTCLLIGCSLEEELRNILMRCAQINPGSYHYYVHYMPDGVSGVTEAQRELISETNFNVYNLITLFLTGEQIGGLLELINEKAISQTRFEDLAAENSVQIKYNYYLTGPIGVGKSTTANLLRNLHVLDEWLHAKPPVLAKPWDELDESEREEADRWIAGQFRAKNDTLRHIKDGITVVDRPPLDPLAFAKKEERAAKAKSLLNAICPAETWLIESGVVIVLLGDPAVLSARVRATGRSKYSDEKLARMQSDILEIYQGDGIHKIDTRNRTVFEVMKEVAEIIHVDEYRPFNLMSAFRSHEGGASASA